LRIRKLSIEVPSMLTFDILRVPHRNQVCQNLRSLATISIYSQLGSIEIIQALPKIQISPLATVKSSKS